MAIRFATGDNKIAMLVRQRQDAAEYWQILDKALVKSLGQLPKDRDQAAEATLWQSIEKNKNLLKELDYKLETNFPRFAEFSNNKPLELADVQVLLGTEEALFSLTTFNQNIYAFLVRKDEVQAYEVDASEEELIDMVDSLRDDINLIGLKNITNLPKFDLDIAHQLYNKLLGPAKETLEGVKHLLFVPTGAMESLPLNVLLTAPPAVKGSDFDRYRSATWLPKRFSITRLPSVSSLRALRIFAKNTRSTVPFKGFGDPVLNGQSSAVRGLNMVNIYQEARVNTDKLRELPELPETSNELRLIAKYLNASEGDLYLRERASETELKSADLSNSSVLAFATHGLVAGELSSLAEPALVLTPPTIGSDLDDGLLAASEVAQLNLNADMVILSACNTASGSELGAKGLSGLARAFIYAGARSLLVSHWSVDSGAAV
ncbi:CHAT domain-containing protein, partial [Planktomarina temperata]|nr:CHAT domain-containing protein [Planktomarina temperata]